MQRVRSRQAGAAFVENFHADRLVAMRLLLQGDQDAGLFAPRPDPVVVDEREPEAGVLGQGEAEEALVPGQDFQAGLGEHDAVVGDDGIEGDIVDVGGEQPGGLMALEFQGELEARLQQPVGQAGGNGAEVLFQQARNALPFGQLQGGGQMVHRHLQAAVGLDGNETALQIDLGGLHAPQDRLRRLVGDGGLISGLQQVLPDDAAVQLDFPFLQAIGGGVGRLEKIGNLLALEADALGIDGKEDAKAPQAGIFDLILQIGGDLDLGFADGGVLQAGDLDPRVHLLNVQREVGGRLQQAEGQHPFLADAGFLRVQLGVAFAGGGLQAHALLGHNQQGAALLVGFAQDHLRAPSSPGRFSRPGRPG